MKKFFLLSMIILVLTGCNNKNIDENIDENILEEKFIIGHTLNDGRAIYFTFDVPYKGRYVTEALTDRTINIDDFFKNLNYLDTLNDGGSKLYEYSEDKNIYGTENFYVIACNSLDNIKDIYVAKNKENIRHVCSKHIDDLNGVSMSIKEGTLTNIGATIVIKDISNRENIYGEDFTIEKYDNGIWIELDNINDLIFNTIGYTVGDDKKLELEVNWEYFYGKLEKGTYRILKTTGKSGEGIRHYITTEFTID